MAEISVSRRTVTTVDGDVEASSFPTPPVPKPRGPQAVPVYVDTGWGAERATGRPLPISRESLSSDRSRCSSVSSGFGDHCSGCPSPVLVRSSPPTPAARSRLRNGSSTSDGLTSLSSGPSPKHRPLTSSLSQPGVPSPTRRMLRGLMSEGRRLNPNADPVGDLSSFTEGTASWQSSNLPSRHLNHGLSRQGECLIQRLDHILSRRSPVPLSNYSSLHSTVSNRSSLDSFRFSDRTLCNGVSDPRGVASRHLLQDLTSSISDVPSPVSPQSDISLLPVRSSFSPSDSLSSGSSLGSEVTSPSDTLSGQSRIKFWNNIDAEVARAIRDVPSPLDTMPTYTRSGAGDGMSPRSDGSPGKAPTRCLFFDSERQSDVPWSERKQRMDNALAWLRTELDGLRAIDRSLLHQFQRCQDTLDAIRQQRQAAWDDCSEEGDLLDEEEDHWEDWEISEFENSFAKGKDLSLELWERRSHSRPEQKSGQATKESSPSHSRSALVFHQDLEVKV